MSVKNPSLIQRATIRHSIPSDATVSKSVRLDCMGSAEFEFGALPKSLRSMAIYSAMHEDWIKPIVLHGITDREGKSLRCIGLPKSEVETYTQIIQLVIDNKIRLQERHKFEDCVTSIDQLPDYHYLRSPGNKHLGRDLTDFWWDLNNNIMMSFNKHFMNNLHLYLKNSWQVMGALVQET